MGELSICQASRAGRLAHCVSPGRRRGSADGAEIGAARNERDDHTKAMRAGLFLAIRASLGEPDSEHQGRDKNEGSRLEMMSLDPEDAMKVTDLQDDHVGRDEPDDRQDDRFQLLAVAGSYVPGSVRAAMARRFQALIVATASVRSDNSLSLNCGRTSS